MSALKFCRECNNMLYPREDKQTRTLLYACQSCEDEEIATDTCVYKRVIRKPVGEPKDVLKDATTDPSLPCTRSVRCYNCNHPEAAFFSGPNFGRGSHDTVLHLLQPKLRPQVEGLRRVWVC